MIFLALAHTCIDFCIKTEQRHYSVIIHYATGDLLDILPMLLKDDDLVDAEHHAGPGDLPGQVGAELCGLGVVQDRAGQGHAHRVPAT